MNDEPNQLSDASEPTEITQIEADQTVFETGSDKFSVPRAKSHSTYQHPDQIAHFSITRVLGQGGMGAVYLAEQTEPVARQVAVKVIHTSLRSQQALESFTSER